MLLGELDRKGELRRGFNARTLVSLLAVNSLVDYSMIARNECIMAVTSSISMTAKNGVFGFLTPASFWASTYDLRQWRLE